MYGTIAAVTVASASPAVGDADVVVLIVVLHSGWGMSTTGRAATSSAAAMRARSAATNAGRRGDRRVVDAELIEGTLDAVVGAVVGHDCTSPPAGEATS